ncbi:MAG TPA: PIG-L family deacetylase [Vicinamibacteria bacterium]|jgi:LmbE family N-acetylglucosaminyl deacetylase|nr:PIG-L family deacetylase [Vicinamibacteria bacterium]
MNLNRPGAEIWVPDGQPPAAALSRTTHLGIGAHQDDVEILAQRGILDCFDHRDRWFTAVVVTDGAGSARSGPYAAYTDDQMRAVRKREQKKAGTVGEYSAVVLLDYTSGDVKAPKAPPIVADLAAVLSAARPEIVYTHNLADKHDTHVGTALRVIEACRTLPAAQRPSRVLGGEVWRDLDWMCDPDKVALDVQDRESLTAALLGVFDSQITGGKRYDLATAGRQRAHATYHQSHSLDATVALTFAMDLTPLVQSDTLDPLAYAKGYIERFAAEVTDRVRRLS